MHRNARWLVFGSLLAAACSEGTVPTQSDTATAPAPSFAIQSGEGYLTHVHVMPPKAQNWEALAKTAAGNIGGGTGISYHGGPVLHTVNVAAIYWGSQSPMYTGGPTAGSGAGSGDGSLIGAFLRGVSGSSYWKINTDYYDGTGSRVPLAVNYTKYWADNVNGVGSATTDAGIQAEVIRAIGVLGYDANTIYAVFTGPGVNLGGGFTTQYCAYHGKFTWNGNVVIYSAQPYNDGVSVCSMQTTGPNGPTYTGDATVNTLAHEIDEAATDPQLNAWWDRRGYENADKCAWTFGTTYPTGNGAQANMKLPAVTGRDFLIQRNWLNRGSGGCSTGI